MPYPAKVSPPMRVRAPSLRPRPGVLVLALVLAASPSARSDVVLWYNGDFDNNNSLTNARSSATNYSYVYDDFVIPAGQTWAIDRVWSNDLMTVNATRAFWAIRKGMAAGNAGTLEAGGVVAAATVTPTGRTDAGTGYPEEKVQVANLNVVLGAGTYYLTVAPVTGAINGSFLSTTSGAHAVGTPPGNDGNSFVYSPAAAFNWNYLATSNANVLGPNPNNASGWDFSEGVAGAVPEPSPLGLTVVMAGAALAAGWVRRRARS